MIRVRDRLDPIGDLDVCVDSTDGVVETVKALLRRLSELGRHTEDFDEYLRCSARWAVEQANLDYGRVLLRSLASEYPNLAAELDSELNGGVRPESIHPGSNDRYWWRCPHCDHRWETAVAGRVGAGTRSGTGCPRCSKQAGGTKRAMAGPGESLADHFPALIAEWDTARNAEEGFTVDTVKPFSLKSMWWICPAHGHSYQTQVATRTSQGSGCPYCANRKVMVGFNDLATTHPGLALDWDHDLNHSELGVTATEVTAGSDKRANWLCHKCGRRWQARVYARMQGRNRCRCRCRHDGVQSPD